MPRIAADRRVDGARARDLAAHEREVGALHACAPRAASPASAARARSSRPPAGRSCPCRGDARCPARASCSSAGRMVQRAHSASCRPSCRCPDARRVPRACSRRARRRPRGRYRARSPRDGRPTPPGAAPATPRTASPLFTLRLPGTCGAVHAHVPLVDEAREPAARLLGQQAREGLVQPQARQRARNREAQLAGSRGCGAV